MTNHVIASLDQVTAEGLTDVLISSGALDAGSVASVVLNPGRGNWSAGASNILVPRQGDRPIYLIDRQPFNWSLTAWLGAP
jgi:hypothetical protein